MKKYKVIIDGKEYMVEVEEVFEARASKTPSNNAAPAAISTPPIVNETSEKGGGAIIKAPMPGIVLLFKVNMGQAVAKGDVLLILEAMKMENEITAPIQGKVRKIAVTPGAAVSTGDILIEIGD